MEDEFGKQAIIKILQERDGITKGEAIALVEQTQTEINESDYDYSSAQDILEENLGLEPDYLMAFLPF